MKKIVVVFFALFACVSTRVLSEISFSSGESRININNNSTLFIDVPVLSIVGGTVTQSETGSVVGGMVVVSNEGHFIHGTAGTSVGLYGNFTQLANGSYSLPGNTRLSATFGPIAGPVNVSNINNRIEGNAYFQSPITLLDGGTILTLAVDNVINQPIILNGGTLILDSDISLGYGGKIVGPGLVDGGGRGSLRLSGTADQWNTELTFRNLRAIALAGETALTGTWAFEGESNLVGGGSLLDLKALGVIQLTNNSVLKMSGVKVSDLIQSSLCLSPTATIFFSDVNLSTSLTMTFSAGTYIVSASSVFNIGKKDLFINESARLTVDAATLWLDSSDYTGQTIAQSDGSSPYIKKINGGLIRQLTDLDHVISSASRTLLSGDVHTNLVLNENVSLKPNQAISYSGNATLDGNGASILFSRGATSQLNIPSGVAVTFSSVNLMRISNNTINVASGGTLNMGSNVLWELDQDVVLSTGQFILTGGTDVFRIRGNGGRKKLTLAPADDLFSFTVNSNTLLLEDIELVGIENVHYSFTTNQSGQRVAGVVGLAGSSVVDIRDDAHISLLVNGRDSGIVLVNNNLTLNGKVFFGLAPENVLNIFFALQSGSDSPNVYFGDGFCPLTSLGGNAGINFLNDQVTLSLLEERSLVAGERSFISGKAVAVAMYPIKISSTQFTVRQGTDLYADGITNPIDLVRTRVPTLFDDLGGSAISAYQLHELTNNYLSAKASYSSYLEECVRVRSLETRGRIRLPTPTVRVMGRMALSRGIGDIALTSGGSLSRFLPDKWAPISLSLTGGSRVDQKRIRTFVPIPLRSPSELQVTADGTFSGLKEVDTVYVTKGQNTIAVSSDFNILGSLSIDEGAELIFELSNGAVLTFGEYQNETTPNWSTGVPMGYRLNLPKSSTIRFTGHGSARFSDGSEIICDGSTFSANVSSDNTTLFSDDRPEIVVSDSARLSVSDHRRLAISGRGKLNITTNGEINIGDGKLTIGSSDSDYFDVNATRQGFVRASVARSLNPVGYVPSAQLIFNQGFFNVLFTERSAFEVGDRGIAEISLNNNAQTRGFINSWTFSAQGCLSVVSGGILSFGSNRYAPAGSSNVILPINWNNSGGEAIGGGTIRAVDGTVSGGRILFQSILQKSFFATSRSTNLEIVRKLSNITPFLVNALDYILVDGTRVVKTTLGNPCQLLLSDVIISEDLQTGNLSGIQFDGQQFIVAGGVRTVVRQ